MKKAKCQEWINVFVELEDLHEKGWLTDKEFATKEDTLLRTMVGFLAMVFQSKEDSGVEVTDYNPVTDTYTYRKREKNRSR